MPGGIVMGILSPVTGRIYDKIGPKWLAIIGLSIVTVGMFMLTNLSLETSFLYLAIVNTITMIGVTMVMMPLTTAALNQLPTKLIPHGTAMNNTIRQVAGAIGTAVLVTIMTSSAIDPKVHGMEGTVHGVIVAFWCWQASAWLGLSCRSILKEPFRQPKALSNSDLEGITPNEQRTA